ncbi:soil-associated protein, TIGR03435 family [Granulicella pectinivorans]|uniref:Soil-associated protein, TIGR03435 family n=1 Tax=Granulicella pectinivorans TaxID=474950 RepID=A0A1I6MJW4_9BACT|nr:TIGR03435 family protein [Granulicella pectinivorans]SFS15962.1 soil-associated protein, TIGR03435 family [Granulicella pectinivorans]
MTLKAFSFAAILALASPSSVLMAQSLPTFDAVAIHRNQNGGDARIDMTRGRLTMTNASLRTLIRTAYDLQNYQFVGGPSWLDSDTYDISAVTGDQTEVSQDGFRKRVMSLLADRFRLKAHWETRQGDVYALVVAKKGPALQAAAGSSKAPGLNTDKSSHLGRMTGTNVPVSYLSTVLGIQLKHPVLDKTGLAGTYDWTLVWDPDPDADSTEPSLFQAVQEQLGLKLDPQKGPVQMLVIDSVTHPSEN